MPGTAVPCNSKSLCHVYLFLEFIIERSTLHETVSSADFSSIIELVTAHENIDIIPGTVKLPAENQMYIRTLFFANVYFFTAVLQSFSVLVDLIGKLIALWCIVHIICRTLFRR